MKKLVLIFGILLLKGLCFGQNPELTLQTGHSGVITNFAFSYDGKYMASVGKDNIIILWDFTLGKQLKILTGHHDKINSILFFNHDYNLISADESGKVIYWDSKSGNIIHSIELTKPIYSIDISSNDSLLAIGGCFPEINILKINRTLLFYKEFPVWDKKDSLRYIKATNIKGEKVYLVNPSCLSVLFNHNNDEIVATRAAINSKNHNILLCEVVRFSTSTSVINKIPECANYICYSNHNKNLLMSVLPSRIISWNIEKNKKIFTRPGNFKKNNFIQISTNANDSLIAAINEDGVIYIWKNTGHYLKTINQIGFITTSIIFHPKKHNLLIVGDDEGSITIFDINSGTAIKKLESGIHPITSIAINNSETMLVTGSKDHLIRTFEMQNKITAHVFYGHKGIINGLNFISDTSFVSTSLDNRICLWSINSNIFSKKIKGNSNPIYLNAIVNSPVLSLFINSFTSYIYANNFILHNYESLDASAFCKGKNIIAAGGKGFNKGIIYQLFIPRIFPIHIIDGNKMNKTGKLKAHYLSINSVDFNHTGELLASCGNDYKTGSIISRKQKNIRHSAFPTYFSLKIWDIKKQKNIKTFENPFEIKSLKFNPNNDTLLFSDGNNNVVLFDFKKDTAQKIYNGNSPLLFDAEGKNIFFQDKTNSLVRYNLKQSTVLNLYSGHNNQISSCVIYPDGKQIATASLDGTVKIWNIEKGSEVATLYAINNDDFIFKTPDYYYYATKNAKKEIGFTFGIKFYPFEQFDLQYNRPDIVLARLGIASEGLIKAYYQAYNKRLKKMGFSESMFENDFHLPEVNIIDADKLPIITTESKLSFKVNATDSKYNLNRINVWVNNVPVNGTNGINLRPFHINTAEKEIIIDLSQGINKVQISCLNEKGVESLKESFEINYLPQKIKKPDLYIVSIGASEYENKDWNLNYAAKDASDFSELFSKQRTNYENIFTNKITNQEVTIENIRALKQKLQLSHVDDVVIIFYAGHGLLDDSLDYYLATYNINFNKPSENGLKYEDMDELLDSIPARNKVLLIDACHSGEVDKESEQNLVTENIVEKNIVFRGAKPRGYHSQSNIGYNNSFELMKELFSDIKKGTGAVVVSSAGGGEYAFEGESWKNGVFTYSLLEGINSGLADKNKDQNITVSEIQEYVMTHVQSLTKGRQKPTTRQENIDNDFVLWKK